MATDIGVGHIADDQRDISQYVGEAGLVLQRWIEQGKWYKDAARTWTGFHDRVRVISAAHMAIPGLVPTRFTAKMNNLGGATCSA
ncbi:hypothetical protein CVS29_17410 [Arthrobacter psychrochitiniphilus]|uniref:Uncharacterized protein n=1 Tax=Arthrobacter psychrochitiniphilus TaxID=291045 RepID=A0A2V3DNH4_9MICC|nr:hypothetical protein CVS29_17410 [Arthrobacter psychrochitiniphilus]